MYGNDTVIVTPKVPVHSMSGNMIKSENLII